MPDPKLVHLMAVMLKKARQQDCAAIVILSSQKYLEYGQHIATSWSHMWPVGEAQRTGVRVLIKREDFKTEEDYKEAATNTFGLLAGQIDCLTMLKGQQEQLLCMVAQRIKGVNISTHETAQEAGPSGPKPLGEVGTDFYTKRPLIEFKDTDDVDCDLMGTEDTLGVGQSGNLMQLDREQVKGLIAHLAAWLETGSIDFK